MAESVDAADSKSAAVKSVWVRVPLPAPACSRLRTSQARLLAGRVKSLHVPPDRRTIAFQARPAFAFHLFERPFADPRATAARRGPTRDVYPGFRRGRPHRQSQRLSRPRAPGAAPVQGIGAVRMVEAWGDDVPRGKLNDFHGAVQAGSEETVVFSWMEYPDKATRDAG